LRRQPRSIPHSTRAWRLESLLRGYVGKSLRRNGDSCGPLTPFSRNSFLKNPQSSGKISLRAWLGLRRPQSSPRLHLRMNDDTRWLTRLAIEQGLLTRDQVLQV